MEVLNQKQKIVAIIVIAVVVCVIGYYYINSTKDVYDSGYEVLNNEKEVAEEVKEETNTNVEQKTILVHIAGAVKIQGIVEVKENARINDVIEEAGGTTENSDLSKVNLAYKVEDGQKIYIPSITEREENIQVTSNDAGKNVIEGYTYSNSNGKININTATAESLETLPGIGASSAQKIITYRETNGKFKTIEELKNVSGVGSAKYETIKDLICI